MDKLDVAQNAKKSFSEMNPILASTTRNATTAF